MIWKKFLGSTTKLYLIDIMIDSDLISRHSFEVLSLTKEKIALCKASSFIESLNLKDLSFDQKVLKLIMELDLQKKKIDDFEFSEYLIFADHSSHLYNIFLERSLFYDRDEPTILEDSLVLIETYKQLSQLLLETKAQLPIFTSTAPGCCWSLIKNNQSLTEVFEGMIDLNDPPGPLYEQLFGPIFDQGAVQCEKDIAEFKRKYPCDSLSEDNYQTVIFRELNKLRVDWNERAYPDYYHFLLVKQNLKSYLLNNCFLNRYIENHQIELTNAFVINEMIKFLENELGQINKKLIRTSADIDLLIYQIKEIISVMLPNHELINELKKAFAKTTKSLKVSKPILFIVLDLEDSFKTIFAHALTNLQQFLETQPSDKKVTYALRQIIDLEYMEAIESKNEHNLNSYIADLKKPFKTQLDCLQFQQNYKPAKKNHSIAEIKTQDKKKFSFGFIKSPDFLSPIIKTLTDNLNFLDPQTTNENFIRIVTSDDLASINDKIYLGCKTNEFRYLIKYFKAFFKSFNPATIGKSGIFISNTGHTITADCIYNSKSENLQTKFTIDNIFNKR